MILDAITKCTPTKCTNKDDVKIVYNMLNSRCKSKPGFPMNPPARYLDVGVPVPWQA